MTKITSPDGTPLSRLCFGAMQFGGKADDDDSLAMYEACRDAGLNFFDTAHVYTDGASETMLGRFAATERDRLVIATKVSFPGGSGRASILSSVEESRGRLGLDVIDVLYLHRWDAETPLEETFETLAGLQRDGTVRHLAVSNFAAWQVMKAQGVAATFDTRIDMIQPMYNLVKRQAEVEILPMARDQGIAVVPYSPLGGGLLTGKYRDGTEGRLTSDARYAKRYGLDWMHRCAADLAVLAEEAGTAPATLAVAWVLRNPDIAAPIVSARNAEQLAPSLAALSFDLDDALHARITALSQTPPPATDRLEEA
ncbi:aldo/keto reductase [Palleronia aestuarii]|nr:aldo/keto reductase [Palleronia aestuarii]